MAARPFLKWVGGKSRQVPALIHDILKSGRPRSYYEPFLGGGAVALELMNGAVREADDDTRYFLSDGNVDLMHCWNMLRNSPDAVLAALRSLDADYLHLPTLEEQCGYYLDVRNFYNADATEDAVRAAVFIWLNRNCFQGMWRVNQRGAFNVPPRRHHAARTRLDWDALTNCARLLGERRVSFGGGDFSSFTPADGDAFVFCDPPYLRESSGRGYDSYTSGGFGVEDHVRLAAWLRALPCRWLLTIGGEESTVRRIYGDPVKTSVISCTFSARSQGRHLRNEYIYGRF